MKTIYKQSILDLMSHEISIAEMNCKRIAYFELTEEDYEDLRHELKYLSFRLSLSDEPEYDVILGKIYGVNFKVVKDKK